LRRFRTERGQQVDVGLSEEVAVQVERAGQKLGHLPRHDVAVDATNFLHRRLDGVASCQLLKHLVEVGAHLGIAEERSTEVEEHSAVGQGNVHPIGSRDSSRPWSYLTDAG
jgi:hypothetical protein